MKINKQKFCGNQEIINIQSNLFSFILSLVPHKQDAEDILQKTNLILCEKHSEFNPSLGKFKHWAFKIAKFQVMAYRTHQKRSKICFSNELTEILADEYTSEHNSKIQKKALDKCYGKLPDHMQKIAELRFKRSLSLQQISSSVQRPIGAISATLHRIRQNILGCIHQAYDEAEREYDEERFKTIHF